MFKISCRLLIAALMFFSVWGCRKDNQNEEENYATSLLKSEIVLANQTLHFEAKGNQVSARRNTQSGMLAHTIMASTQTNPKYILGITLSGISTPGTYTHRSNAILTLGLDATNANATNVFASDLSVTVQVTKITETDIEGTFSAKIVNEEGTLTGLIKNGQFKAKL
jgi:hypothetical protein